MSKLTKEKLDSYLNNTNPIGSFVLKKHLYKFNLKEQKCECCGLTEWRGLRIPLELHHIDGNNKNNNLSNLQILCSNCHGQTNNFRAGNSQRSKKNKPSLTDEQYIDAIQKSTNPRQACILLGIAPYGGNYERIRKVANKSMVNFRLPTEEEKMEATIKRKERMEELREIKKKFRCKEISPRKNKYETKEEANFAIRKVKDRPSKEELIKLMEDYPLVYIGKLYDVCDNTIRKWIKTYEVPLPNYPKGYWRRRNLGMSHEEAMVKKEKPVKKKLRVLTIEQVKEIKVKLCQNGSIKKLSEEYGVSYECIKQIKYGYTYASVTI